MVVWLIGLSGAGKTTIGEQVYRRLKDMQDNVVFLDGDQVRAIMGNDLGYTAEARLANATRISNLCKVLNDQGIDVVCCILSFREETRRWNRAHIDDYYEVYVRVPMELLVERDSKGLYRGAASGEIDNVVGVDIRFEEPQVPDLVIDNDQQVENLTTLVESILAGLQASRPGA